MNENKLLQDLMAGRRPFPFLAAKVGGNQLDKKELQKQYMDFFEEVRHEAQLRSMEMETRSRPGRKVYRGND